MVRVRVRDVDRGQPVGGVTIRIEAGGQQATAVTDSAGLCHVTWPARSGSARFSAMVDDGVVLGAPARIGPQDLVIDLAYARKVVLSGVVRDPKGIGVAEARVYLTVPTPEGDSGMRLESSLLTRTDPSGVYRVEVPRGWLLGSHLVAVAGRWIPASSKLDSVRTASAQVDLQFAEGVPWRLRVTDEQGNGVSGCKFRAMTSDSPFLADWTPDEVPDGAGGEIGLVSRRIETDANGVAKVEGWPQDRGARVRVFDESSRRFHVIQPEATAEAGHMLAFNPRQLADATIHVRIEHRTTVLVRGELVGFAPADVDRLRLTRRGPDGGNEMVRLRQLPQGGFEASFSTWGSDRAGLVKLSLMATMDGTDWRLDLGCFELLGAPELTGLIIRK